MFRYLLVLTVLFIQAAGAATYYVAPWGSDANPGDNGAPFRTLQRGVDAAGPGDFVIVKDGTYLSEGKVSCESCDVHASPVVMHNSGTPDAYIVIRAENKWGAVLDCEMLCDSYIDLYRSSYLIIEGFVITRGVWEGIHSNNDAHDIAIRGNRIENIGNRDTDTHYGLDGLYTNANCHDFVIDANVFANIGRTNIVNSLDHALYLHGYNYTIVNNTFYNSGRGWAIQMADGLSNVWIANNTFVDPNPYKDGQILMWNWQSNITIRDNTFENPRGVAIERYDSNVSGCTVAGNVVRGAYGVISDGSGCDVYDNRME